MISETLSLFIILLVGVCSALFPEEEQHDGKSWKAPTYPAAGYSSFSPEGGPLGLSHLTLLQRQTEPLRKRNKIVRITSPTNFGFTDSGSRSYAYVHHYAKTPVWNIDQSLLLTGRRPSDYKVALMNANNYNVIRWVRGCSYYRWSALDPDIYWCMSERACTITRCKASDGCASAKIVLDWSSEFNLCMLGPSEGNVDRYDRHVAYVCFKDGVDRVTIVVGNLQTGKEVSRRSWTGLGVSNPSTRSSQLHNNIMDWASVSQSGEFVAITWRPGSGSPYGPSGSARSYRVSDFQEVKEFARQSLEHADLCLDSAGDDVLMMMGSMNSYRLRDGKVVNQVKRATAAGMSGHASCRNYLRPGYAYASANEFGRYWIVSFPLDGSQRLEVWGQTRSASRSSEVVPSPRGDRVLFKSNAWNPNNQQMGYVYDSETAMPRGAITSVTGGTLPTSPPVTPQPTTKSTTTTTKPTTKAITKTTTKTTTKNTVSTSTGSTSTTRKLSVYVEKNEEKAVKFADFRAGASCSVAVSLVYGDEALQLIYDVTDDTVYAPAASRAVNTWYSDDSAEFFIAGASTDQHFHVIVSAAGLATLMNEKNDILSDSTGFSATSKLQTGGYNVEIEMTWAMLGYDDVGQVRASPPLLILAAVDNDGDSYDYFDAEGLVEKKQGWGFAAPFSLWPSLDLVSATSAPTTTSARTASSRSDGTSTSTSTATLDLYKPIADCVSGDLLCACRPNNECNAGRVCRNNLCLFDSTACATPEIGCPCVLKLCKGDNAVCVSIGDEFICAEKPVVDKEMNSSTGRNSSLFAVSSMLLAFVSFQFY